jgi:hypothetical protein
MPEVTYTSHDESNVVLVTAINRVLIPQTATWLGNDCHAGLASILDCIAPGCKQDQSWSVAG